MIKILLVSLLICGCTVDAEINEETKNSIITCKDTRDGEVFSFYGNTVTNVRSGYLGAASTFDMVTTDGIEMTLSSDMEAYMKCSTKPINKGE